MHAGTKVWANVGTGAKSTWVKATVLTVERTQQERSHIAKFGLEIENMSEENKSILTHMLGDQLEIVTCLVEGSTDEYESVKMRNEIDDFDAQSIEDLVNLHHLHECSILNCLSARYQANRIYTSTGPVLISVNPYKPLKLYTPEVVQAYREAGEKFHEKRGLNKDTDHSPDGDISALPPHVYRVADLAYRHLEETVRGAWRPGGGKAVANQSILVSGESGAGYVVL